MYKPTDPFRFFYPKRILKKAKRIAWKLRPRRPRNTRMWLRLSYYDEVLSKLNEENQRVFIEEFYSSSRQVNYITLMVFISVIGIYISTFQFRIIGFWEAVGLESLLVFLLFYLVRYYRLGMEDLLRYLIKKETSPDYAFRG